jgi:hypothetical protein
MRIHADPDPDTDPDPKYCLYMWGGGTRVAYVTTASVVPLC